jgi:protocatechuate 3,4-dioxygenase beta subunit
MTRLLPFALLSALACAAPCRCQEASAETYTIAGVVVNAADGKPLKRVRVAIAPVTDQTHQIAITTGADGRFRFDRVQAGNYALSADTPKGVRYIYGEAATPGFGIGIVVKQGQRNEDIVFRLPARAAIHGRIVDQDGDPVEGAAVQLYHSVIMEGRRKVYLHSSSSTDEAGEYRFSALPSGTWHLAASGRPWYTNQVQSNPSSPLARMSYPATFYPGGRDPRSAAPLRLQAGQDLAADFTLVAVPGGSIEVSIKPPVSYARVEIGFEGIAGSRCVERSENVRSGSRIEGLPPGRYAVSAWAEQGGAHMYAEQSVQVGSGESKMELTFGEAPVVTGTVSFDDSGPAPAGTLISMLEEECGCGIDGEVGGDGRFRIGPISPGAYRLAVADSSWRPQGIHRLLIDGAPAKGQLLEIFKPVKLEVVATRGGSVSGLVFANDAPAPGALAVLAPRKDSTNPFDYHGYMTDSDGSFEFTSVAPGDYVLFAVGDFTDFEYANPDTVRPYLSRGQPVHIEAGKSSSIRLTLP